MNLLPMLTFDYNWILSCFVNVFVMLAVNYGDGFLSLCLCIYMHIGYILYVRGKVQAAN